MSLSSSTRKEPDSLFFQTTERISLEHVEKEYTPEKLYQIWIRSQTLSNINHQGYAVLNYLEEFIVNNQYPEHFFLLIIQTFAKNEYFYRSILNDRTRFERLFQSATWKSVCLLRYLQVLYGYCPRNLVGNVAVDFYRFVVENYLREKSIDLDGLAVFSSLVDQFYQNNDKTAVLTDQEQAIEYSHRVIDTLLQHHSNGKINSDLKLIETITKTIAIVWEQTSAKEK